jgi:hypothetical protein
VYAAEPHALFLPPGVPGYGKDAPQYSAGPRVTQARALVGGRTVHANLLADASNPRNETLTAEVKRDLARVGIDVRVRLAADPWGDTRKPGSTADLLLDGWSSDYPDGSNFFTGILDPRDGFHFYPGWLTDAHWLGRIRAAERVQGPGRAAAYRKLDRDLATHELPVTGLTVNVSPPQLFSARVSCHTFLPQFAGLADPTSLCLG